MLVTRAPVFPLKIHYLSPFPVKTISGYQITLRDKGKFFTEEFQLINCERTTKLENQCFATP